MNRFLTAFLAVAFCFMASAGKSQRPTVALTDFSSALKHKARKAPSAFSLEGTWKFVLGDYWYEESSMSSIECDYEVTDEGSFFYFDPIDAEGLPMGVLFDSESNILTLTAGTLGDFNGYGILVQRPSFYDHDLGRFVPSVVTASFDPETMSISFPADSGVEWWLYDYENQTPITEIYGYTFEGATKIKDADPGEEIPEISYNIVINKYGENPVTLRLGDFSTIHFVEGNVVFDTADGFSIPLAELATIHVEENDELLSVESPVDASVRLNYLNGNFSIVGLPEDSTLSVYALSGAKVISVTNYNGQSIDISSLPGGVYIIHSAPYSFKVVK